MPRKVIIDCDPGLDDALAILLAGASSELDIIGITTVAGNVSAEQSGRNALRICQVAGLTRIPVYVGLAHPIKRERVEEYSVHGKCGLNGAVLPEPTCTVASTHAVEFLVDTLTSSVEGVTLITLGPLTNVASALVRNPEIKNGLDQIIVMGGSVHEGNVTPFAEFNVYSDPHAAKIVFESDIPLVMVGLNVTHQALALPERIKSLVQKSSAVSKMALMCIERLGEFYRKICGYSGPPLHDPCAVAVAIDQTLIQTREMAVEVEIEDRLSIGRTFCDAPRIKGLIRPIQVGVGLDADRFFSLLNDRLARYD